MRLVDSKSRFPCLVAPTGSGKTGIIAATIRLLGGKWVWLVSTKTLADQITSELGGHLKYADVRGQSNYPCPIDLPLTVDLGPCHAGQSCDLRLGGCPYYDAVRHAHAPETRVTTTNYAFWLHGNRAGEGFPPIDGLVLDEAHAAPDELASFLSCMISRESVRKLLHGYTPPLTRWKWWAKTRADELEGELERIKFKARTDKAQRALLRTARLLLLKLNSLAIAPSEADWVVEEGKYGWSFDPVSPAPYSETLFRNTPKVILVSATMRPKTLSLLGLKVGDYDFQETPSSFPVQRRPVYHYHGIPRVALSFRAPESTLRLWVARIDAIIRGRLDRKGIIHTVSYARRDFLLRSSEFAHLFITHDSGGQAAALSRFRGAVAPAIFLSPSATTGIDLPGVEAEYGIMGKVPFPDLRSKILRARSKLDKEYPFYLAMLDIVQAAGRGMRSASDHHEFFIVDDMWGWFGPKYKRFAPLYFLEALRRIERPPPPPTKLLDRRLATGVGSSGQ